MPTESKGGTFSSIDIPLIKRALQSYLNSLQKELMTADHAEKEISAVANLMHRLNRIPTKEN